MVQNRRFFFIKSSGGSETRMADATIVKTPPTNQYWQHCGPQKFNLSKQTEEARQSRIDWLTTLVRTPLPSGPYPFNVAGRGWFKGYIYDERYQACYVLREDLNLDVQIFQVTRSLDGCVTNRVLIQDPMRRRISVSAFANPNYGPLTKHRIRKSTSKYLPHGNTET